MIFWLSKEEHTSDELLNDTETELKKALHY